MSLDLCTYCKLLLLLIFVKMQRLVQRFVVPRRRAAVHLMPAPRAVHVLVTPGTDQRAVLESHDAPSLRVVIREAHSACWLSLFRGHLV